MLEQIKNIINQFDIIGEIIDIEIKSNGNINETYVVTYKTPKKEIKKYILQKINTKVFKDPYKLMKNIENITNWIENKCKLLEDINRPCLKVIQTKNKKTLAVINNNEEKQYYRVYNYIENSICYEVSKDKSIIYNAGKGFGNFQKMLIDYPINNLETIIVDFHNTPKIYQDFFKNIKLDTFGRVYEISKEIDFVIKNSKCVSKLIDLINKSKIPVRVTHNDTKLNNVIMDKETGEYLTIIDLDTVMLGSSLFDYADGVRSSAANSVEDERNLEKVFLNNELFEKYTDGYLSEMSSYLTETEIYNMAEAIRIITFELGIRFLNDYINGDVYFKTNYDKHNLIRARNQFKLLSDIDNKMPYLNEYILNSYKKHKK